MDYTAFLWVIRAVIIGVGAVMFIFIMKWKREGILRERFYIYFLVLGITLLILGNIVLTVSLTNDLDIFYGTYIGAVGVLSLIASLVVRIFAVKSR